MYNKLFSFMKLILSIFLQPDEFLLLFIELESIVNSKLDDKVIWKKCLTVTMDTCMEVFSKVYDISNIFNIFKLSVSFPTPLMFLFPIPLILMHRWSIYEDFIFVMIIFF